MDEADVRINEDPEYWYPLYVRFERDYRDHIASRVDDFRTRFFLLEDLDQTMLDKGWFASWLEEMPRHERDQYCAAWRDGHEAYLTIGRERLMASRQSALNR